MRIHSGLAGWPSPLRLTIAIVPYSIAFLLLLPASARAQEYSIQDLPASVRPGHVPADKVMYGAFLRNEAVFERKARAEEAKGNSGDQYRRFFVRRFGITDQEQAQIATLALDYYDQWLALKAQLKDATDRFVHTWFPGNRYPEGATLPPIPAEITTIEHQIKTLTLAKRDEVHARLGDARFVHLDSIIRARATHDFEKLDKLQGGQPK